MRLPDNLKTLSCLCATIGGLLLGSTLHAQDLLPANRFNSDSGNWTTASNWDVIETQDDGGFRAADPPDTAVPNDGSIASIRNGGAVSLTSAADDVMHLSIFDGSVNLGDGGSLNVLGQTLVGAAGTIGFSGGSLNTDSLAIQGTLDLSGGLAGDLSFGTSIPVATANSILGRPRRITVDGSVPSLDRGLSLQLVSTDDGASVVVESLPVLEIDRVTGGAQITNFGSGALELKGYTISSASELLTRSRGAWSSLEDQGVDGWAEANPTRTTRFSEVNIAGSTTLDGNSSLDLGTPYNGIGEGPASEDIQFEFILSDGRVFQSDVVYNGAPNDFTLIVNPDSGQVTLSNASTLTPAYEIASYSITSASGSLLSDAFTGIGEDGWENANASNTGVADLNLQGFRTFANESSFDLGRACFCLLIVTDFIRVGRIDSVYLCCV